MPPEARRSSRPPARDTLPCAAERPHASKLGAAAFALIDDLAAPAELGQSGRQWRRPCGCAQTRGQVPEERSVTHPPALQEESPGMRRFVPQRVLPSAWRQMRRDRDAMGPSVGDLSAGEFAPGEPHDRRAEAETSGEPIVEELKLGLRVRIGNRKERVHRIKISRFDLAGPIPAAWMTKQEE